MKIAVTYENGEIFQHFGHTEQIKLYDIENNEIKNSQVISTNGNGHEALADFIKNAGAEILICGGIGAGARNALSLLEITVYGGVKGDADKAVSDFLNDSLDYNENAGCAGHDGHSHGEGHSCGEHKCGEEHSCGHKTGGHGKYNGIIEVTSGNFETEVNNCEDLVVIDFWAVWCGPCQMLSPIIDELSKEISDVKFCKINVDEQQEIAAMYNVRSIPTVVFIKNGRVVDESIGYVPKEELIERIDNNK